MRRLALIAALAAGCNGGGDQASSFGSSITTAPGTNSTGESSGGSSTSTSSGSGEDSTASSAGSTSSSSSGIPDFGAVPDGGEGPPPGCKGKIDFLFSISAASTMKGVQGRLKTSFPGFVATLESEFSDFDYHILVPYTRTTGWGLPWCEGCKDVCVETPEYPCGEQPELCDAVHGAGVTLPVGEDASNVRCELASSRRYITSGQPDLAGVFTCIASVGTNGAAQVAQATVKALADEINGPGGCNDGFLRDDALLVVVAIQDTYDQYSEGTAADWRDALIDAKGGDADAVVLLAISTDIDDPVGLCGYDPTDAEHELRTWTELLPHGLFRSACADDYAPFFAEAAARIKEQCDVFVPQ